VTVIGLDLSLTAPGLCIWDNKAVTLHTDAKTGDRRFCEIRDWIDYYLSRTPIMFAMIEAVPPYDFASSGLERVHGVAREILARHGVPFAYVNVTALKSFATGDGRADKADVMAAVEAESGWRPDDDNCADAWMLRRMGLTVRYGRSVWDDQWVQPLSSVEWPIRPGVENWVEPYGATSTRKLVRKMCGHKTLAMRNGDHWIHPFNVVVCDKPPKTTAR
jgi:crossover junction endodeoxyribonuclease RuvC